MAIQMSDEIIEKLIENVRINPGLYDQTLPQYKDQIWRKNCWEKIAKVLDVEGVSGSAWAIKWKNQRDRYIKVKNQVRQKKSGSGTSATVKGKFYHQMSFLEPFVRAARTESNLPPTATEADDNEDDDTTVSHQLIEDEEKSDTDTSDQNEQREHDKAKASSKKRPVSPSPSPPCTANKVPVPKASNVKETQESSCSTPAPTGKRSSTRKKEESNINKIIGDISVDMKQTASNFDSMFTTLTQNIQQQSDATSQDDSDRFYLWMSSRSKRLEQMIQTELQDQIFQLVRIAERSQLFASQRPEYQTQELRNAERSQLFASL